MGSVFYQWRANAAFNIAKRIRLTAVLFSRIARGSIQVKPDVNMIFTDSDRTVEIYIWTQTDQRTSIKSIT